MKTLVCLTSGVESVSTLKWALEKRRHVIASHSMMIDGTAWNENHFHWSIAERPRVQRICDNLGVPLLKKDFTSPTGEDAPRTKDKYWWLLGALEHTLWDLDITEICYGANSGLIVKGDGFGDSYFAGCTNDIHSITQIWGAAQNRNLSIFSPFAYLSKKEHYLRIEEQSEYLFSCWDPVKTLTGGYKPCGECPKCNELIEVKK